MKVNLQQTVFDDLRVAIRQSSAKLNENKQQRLKLGKKIARIKLNIRAGEILCSKLQTAEIDAWYVRAELEKKRAELMDVRRELAIIEVQRELELSRFRILHKTLDKFNEPFDRKRKEEADIGRKWKKVNTYEVS